LGIIVKWKFMPARPANRWVWPTLFCEARYLEAATCWRLTLVVSELVRNATRHAFENKNGGEIYVEVRANGGGLQCVVSDNGCAPELIEPGRGSAILDGLANDLGGVVSRGYGAGGSTIVVTIPHMTATTPIGEAHGDV
jgi:two-component sensor histidine kinase